MPFLARSLSLLVCIVGLSLHMATQAELHNLDLTTLDMPRTQAVEGPENDFFLVAQCPCPSYCAMSEIALIDDMASLSNLKALGYYTELESLLPISPHAIHGACFRDESELKLAELPPAPAPTHGRCDINRPHMRKGTPAYREAHIKSERQRREGMTKLFATLRSLLPMPDFKSGRSTLLSYVIEYVQHLDATLQQLATTKAQLEAAAAERRAKVRSQGASYVDVNDNDNGDGGQQRRIGDVLPFPSANAVTVRFWGTSNIYITLNCPKKRGLWPDLLTVLQDNLHLDLQNVNLSTAEDLCVHSIYAKVLDADREVSCDRLRAILFGFIATHMGF